MENDIIELISLAARRGINRVLTKEQPKLDGSLYLFESSKDCHIKRGRYSIFTFIPGGSSRALIFKQIPLDYAHRARSPTETLDQGERLALVGVSSLPITITPRLPSGLHHRLMHTMKRSKIIMT